MGEPESDLSDVSDLSDASIRLLTPGLGGDFRIATFWGRDSEIPTHRYGKAFSGFRVYCLWSTVYCLRCFGGLPWRRKRSVVT